MTSAGGQQASADSLPTTVTVDLGARSYDIQIGDGLLNGAGKLIAPFLGPDRRAIIISDDTVAPLYADALVHSLQAEGAAASVVRVPVGEDSKSFARLEQVLEELIHAGVERGTPLIALGGGVVGDLTGFTASTLLRGVPFIQVPTTLLAQVDSSVGGKTGINSRHGKNLIGAFYQPQIVIADTETLKTLSARHLRAGFFGWLEDNGAAVVAGDPEALQYTIATCCRAKARIVSVDEREHGKRALLNLGHTFAHAFEAEAGYGEALLHGEAVAIGMVLAFQLSAKLDLCATSDVERIQAHLIQTGLPTSAADLPKKSRMGGQNSFWPVALAKASWRVTPRRLWPRKCCVTFCGLAKSSWLPRMTTCIFDRMSNDL